MHPRLVRRALLCGLAGIALPAQAQTPPRRRGRGNEVPTPPANADQLQAELLTYQSRGRAIRAAAYRPLGAPRGGVVLLHGSGGIGPEQLGLAQKFAGDGYLALVPTYLDAAEDDTIRALPIMSAWRDCAIDAVGWLVEQGVEPAHTGITGYSLGSIIAVDGALGGGQAAAAIGIAAGQEVYPLRRPRRTIPVLLIRAGEDRTVTARGTEVWREDLDEANVPVRVQVVRGAGHLMTRAQWDEVYDRALNFFNGNIGRVS